MSSPVVAPLWAYNRRMSDVIFIGVVLGFFALAALYVRLCDSMIGPDEMTTDVERLGSNDVPTMSDVPT
ncbi:MAG TPA: hypothetical protein VIH06_03160 [Ilumatobacteraceae bacterium]